MAAPEDKTAALKRHHGLNPRPERVTDPAFAGDNPFFDANDLVQVKYEMLRRVREEGQQVTATSGAFGFSRPSFYEAQAAFEDEGLPGLIPKPRGPRRAHKLSADIVRELQAAKGDDPALTSQGLARLTEERFGLSVHPRSIERALKRRKKGAPETP